MNFAFRSALLLCSVIQLSSCGVGEISGVKISPSPVTQSTPLPEVKLTLPPGCAQDCEAGLANCLSLSESALVDYPGEMSRLFEYASGLKVGVENEMTVGKNGKLRVDFKGSSLTALAFTVKPTKNFQVRRVVSDIPKLEVLPNQTVPTWELDDASLATEWFGPLRYIEVLESRLVFDFSGNCLAFRRKTER